MEKKLRIQLFDDEGRLMEDRMVAQDTEVYSGPKFTHDGIMRIEFTFNTKEDIPKVKDYLDKIVGNLPLGVKKSKTRISKKFMEDPDFREGFLKQAEESMTNQDELINFLRKNDFRFMMYDFLETFEFGGLDIRERDRTKYQWMLRCIRYAKNPKSDKYDPMLIFGFNLYGGEDNKIVVYLNGEFHKRYIVDSPGKPKEIIKKSNLIKYPHYMVEEEREKFRYELRQYESNPEKEFSRFFKRWRPYVENLPPLPQDKKVQDSE